MTYTLEELVEQMILYFQNTSQTQITDFNDGSEANNLIRNLANVLLMAFDQADEIKRMMNPYEAVGVFLDDLATTRGLTRQATEYATGTVTITLPGILGYDVVYPYETYVSTDGLDPIAFYTTSEATISAGNVTVDVPVQAVVGGTDGNVLAGTVVVMVSPVTGTETVTNADPFTGGVDAETDDELRDRIIEAGNEYSVGTPGWLETQAQEVSGVFDAWCDYNLGVDPCTVTMYICGDTRPTPDSVVEDVEEVYEGTDGHIAGIEVLVDKPTFTAQDITFSSITFDPTMNEATIKANLESNIQAYIEGGDTNYGTTFTGLGIGDDLTALTVAQVIDDTMGVLFFELTTPSTNVSVADDECLYMGTVTYP